MGKDDEAKEVKVSIDVEVIQSKEEAIAAAEEKRREALRKRNACVAVAFCIAALPLGMLLDHFGLSRMAGIAYVSFPISCGIAAHYSSKC